MEPIEIVRCLGALWNRQKTRMVWTRLVKRSGNRWGAPRIPARRGQILTRSSTLLPCLSRGISSVAAAALLAAFASAGKPLPLRTQGPVAARAQEDNSDALSRPSSFTVNARLVVLDVVVTDNSGKPVDGLTARDLQIFEDGKQQQIRSFEPPSSHGLPSAADAAGLSAVFDLAQPASFGSSPVNILVLDQLNTHFADSSFARRALHDYLAGQPALLTEPAMLLTVYDHGFRELGGFTRDREALLRALDAAPPEYAWTLEVNGKADYGPTERLEQSLQALEEIAQSSGRIPGRKSLIWVGGGFPTIDPTTIDRDDAQEVKRALQQVTDTLLGDRITLYAVDPSSSAAGTTEITDSSQLEFAELAGDALSGNFDPFSENEDFDRLGLVTGGRVVRGRNDIARQIASSVSLGARSYTVSYTPTSASEAAAAYRRIRIVCLRPGLTAFTRGGYYSGQSPQGESAAAATYDLTAAAKSRVPFNAIGVTAVADASPNAAPAAYIVRAGITSLTWRPQPDGGAAASVYVMAVLLNAKGEMLGHRLNGMTAHAKPGADLHDAARTADFSFSAPASPKATTLRFIVRDSASGRMGSIDLPLVRR